MPIQDAVSPVQKVTLDEMAQEFADRFAVLTFGEPGAEADDKIAVTIQLKNALMQELAAKERIRLTCTAGATMTVAAAGNGTVLSGDGSEDIIIETDELTGAFDLEVEYAGTGDVTIVGGATQGSGFVHCGESLDLTFA
jgi:hypothetical protein